MYLLILYTLGNQHAGKISVLQILQELPSLLSVTLTTPFRTNRPVSGQIQCASVYILPEVSRVVILGFIGLPLNGEFMTLG